MIRADPQDGVGMKTGRVRIGLYADGLCIDGYWEKVDRMKALCNPARIAPPLLLTSPQGHERELSTDLPLREVARHLGGQDEAACGL